MGALPKPATAAEAVAAIRARVEANRERERRLPSVTKEAPPQIVTPIQTEAGPDLMRCALHGVYRRLHEFGRPVGCHHCKRDIRAGLSPEQAAERAAELVEERMDDIGLVGRYRTATFDTFIAATDAQRTALQACRDFADGRDGCGAPWLIGACGLGKTHLLAAVAHHLAFARARRPKLTTPRSIVRRLRATWAKDAEETVDDVICAIAHEPDVLLLDEAGLGTGTDAELLQLYEVIGERYDHSLPTMLASNLPVPELRAALGDRIFDRLREGARVVALDGQSYRGKA